MREPVNVVCIKWGDAYGSEYVNRLHAMVERHLSTPFRFLCFTDDPHGLSSAVDARPLPELALPPDLEDLRWRKLGLFRGLEDENGPVLFLDLDLVIVRSLDPFLEVPGTFLAVRDTELFPLKLSHRFRPRRAAELRITGNTSVVRFQAGAHAELADEFEEDTRSILDRFRNEQEFLSNRLHAQDRLDYWPPGLCVSFKRHCVPEGLRSWLAPPSIPDEAHIVLFAGNLKPHEVLEGEGSKWYRRIGPTPWLAEHWSEGPGEPAVEAGGLTPR